MSKIQSRPGAAGGSTGSKSQSRPGAARGPTGSKSQSRPGAARGPTGSKSPSRPGARGGGGGGFRRRVRRRLIVNPSFQFRAMLPVIVFAIAMFLFFGVFLFYPLHRNVNLDPNPVIQAMLGEQLFVIHLKMWPLVGIAAAIACLYTLQRSLRVAGPLYRLWQVLMRMTQGQYQSVTFREGDEFREFEGVTYRLARKMESLSGVSMTHLSKIESRLYQLKARIEMEDTSLESVRREIDVVLAEFKKPMLSKGA